MKKITTLILSSLLLIGTVACGNNAKTSTNAPSSTEETGQVPDTKTVQKNQSDASSQVRRNQLNSDIRAREQRNNLTGGDADRANSDLSSEVLTPWQNKSRVSIVSKLQQKWRCQIERCSESAWN